MQKKKLNILFITSWYPNPQHPTLGIFIQRHAEALSSLHNISVINVISGANISKPKIEAVERKGVWEIRAKYKKSNSAIGKLAGSTKAFKHAYQEVVQKKGKPDLIHLHVIYPAAVFILLSSSLKKIPLVISEHWSGYMAEDGNYKGLLMKLTTQAIVKRAKIIIAISDKMKNAMIEHGLKNNYTLISNVVDTNLFYPAKEKIDNPAFTFIHVSSINDKEKNISGILKAAQQLAKKENKFIINIIGDSNELNTFKALADKLGIHNTHVFFKGSLNPHEVAEEMRKADAFLLFSNYEGLPCVILEALVCGLPVIATNTGGIPSAINSSNGIMLAPKDEVALQEAMQNTMINYHQYDKNKIARDATEKYSYNKVAEQINEVYQSVLNLQP